VQESFTGAETTVPTIKYIHSDFKINKKLNRTDQVSDAYVTPLRSFTSKIKHAIKHKTSPARLAKLSHDCCSPH